MKLQKKTRIAEKVSTLLYNILCKLLLFILNFATEIFVDFEQILNLKIISFFHNFITYSVLFLRETGTNKKLRMNELFLI